VHGHSRFKSDFTDVFDAIDVVDFD